MFQEEKIKDLEERIALITADNDSLLKELRHYKMVAAGLKGKNKQLSKVICDYKDVVCKKDKTIEELESWLQANGSAIKNLNRKIEQLKSELDALRQEQKPWYKKIFT